MLQYYTSAIPIQGIQNLSQYCTAADYLACPALKPLLSFAAVTLTIAGSGGEGNREEN